MRRLLVSLAALGLVTGMIGCHTAGVCDCANGGGGGGHAYGEPYGYSEGVQYGQTMPAHGQAVSHVSQVSDDSTEEPDYSH
jgi:hypothetical protein